MAKTITELEEMLQYWDSKMKACSSYSEEHHVARQRKYLIKQQIRKKQENAELLQQAMSLGKILERVRKYSPLNDLIATYAYRTIELKEVKALVDGRRNPEYTRMYFNLKTLRSKIETAITRRLEALEERVSKLTHLEERVNRLALLQGLK